MRSPARYRVACGRRSNEQTPGARKWTESTSPAISYPSKWSISSSISSNVAVFAHAQTGSTDTGARISVHPWWCDFAVFGRDPVTARPNGEAAVARRDAIEVDPDVENTESAVVVRLVVGMDPYLGDDLGGHVADARTAWRAGAHATLPPCRSTCRSSRREDV